jgi:hypothetical protein
MQATKRTEIDDVERIALPTRAAHMDRRGVVAQAGRWALLLALVLWSCAEGQAVRRASSPPAHRETKADDRFCDRDTDCQVSDRDFSWCCDHGDFAPYPISRAAMKQKVADLRARCSGECAPMYYPNEECTTRASDWTVVCADHVCERRPATPGITPKPLCPETTAGPAGFE